MNPDQATPGGKPGFTPSEEKAMRTPHETDVDANAQSRCKDHWTDVRELLSAALSGACAPVVSVERLIERIEGRP
jgi:hypothetical protein